MAGPWERWDKGSDPIEFCTVITTTANEPISEIHDRLPVILHPDDYDAWLHTDNDDPDELRGLLMPYPSDEFVATPVSTAVSNVRNDSEQCVLSTE